MIAILQSVIFYMSLVINNITRKRTFFFSGHKESFVRVWRLTIDFKEYIKSQWYKKPLTTNNEEAEQPIEQ